MPVLTFEQGCWLDGARLEGWGNGGALIEMIEEGTSEWILVDADGTKITIESDSSMLAESPDGISMWRDNEEHRIDSPFPLSSDGQRRGPVPNLADDEWLFGASWSPDGTHLAMRLEPGFNRPHGVFRVVDVATGAVMVEVEESDSQVITTAWSKNGRFFLYESWDYAADSGELVFYDTATNTTTNIPLAEIVDEVRIK